MCGVAWYLNRTINVNIKNGYVKNLFANSFFKQNYFFGINLALYSLILLQSVISLILLCIAYQDAGWPQDPQTTLVLFFIFYLFLGPTLVYFACSWVSYQSFKSGKIHPLANCLIIICALLMFLYFILILTAQDNPKLYNLNYFYMIILFFNNILSIPQDVEKYKIEYWWIYIMNIFYIVIMLGWNFYNKNNSKRIINSNPDNRFFN
ncbi:hypothetical protein [Williamsoniiplasma somnilux]|uniref:hypothetical protein n=1 Tax=Williamsoniiplasma somnilux TaxID=215578 RepID=UPI00046324C0|nr:hypothetical protein [Williamsoniiplasma somnilux]